MPPFIVLPQPYPVPFPGVSPGVSPEVSPGVVPGSNPPGIMAPFAELFNVDLNWKYVLAVLFLLLTVNMVEGWNSDYAWTYMAILLLGVIVVDGRFGPQLSALLKGA